MKNFVALIASLWLFASCSTNVELFFGNHQSGITTGSQKFAFVAAFDLTTTDSGQVRQLLKSWTALSEKLTQGLPLAGRDAQDLPPSDTGETLGYRPARLTLTFGVGPSLFDHRFGLDKRRPVALAPLPPFAGDRLNPDWSDGDLVVQVGADDYQTAYHALHTLTRAAKGVAVVRWLQDGFQPGLETNPQGPGRNLEGFIDGTSNPDPRKPEVMDQVVWADRGSDWMAGGTYLVVRRIRMLVEVWDRSSLADQQRTIGQDRATGKALSTQEPDSHVRTVKGAGVEKIFRRPFHYVNGLDPRTGQWDSGLLFLAWMKDPPGQFVPMQTRMSQYDRLNEYIQVVGSGVYAAFPGVAPGSYLGQALFPEVPLVNRIDSLLALLGSSYPALAKQDWAEVRAIFQTWTTMWETERSTAGAPSEAVARRWADWKAVLDPAEPEAMAVKSAQAALVRELVAWKQSLGPRSQPRITELAALTDALNTIENALRNNDLVAANQALGDFQKLWVGRESLVRSLDESVYRSIEVGLVTARLSMKAGADLSAMTVSIQNLQQQLSKLKPPATFGAWDAAFLLLREGLEALLVLGALLAFLAKTDQRRREPWVWAGATAGLVTSVLAALAVSVLLTGGSAAQAPELLEGLAGLGAVVLMLAAGAWLHRKAAVKNWSQWLKQSTGRWGNNPWALLLLAFLAVLREGAETVIFFLGLAGQLPTGELLLGIGGALVVLILLGVAMLGFSKRLPLGWFFPIATSLISFLAVKILGQSLSALQSAGWLTSTSIEGGVSVPWLGFAPSWETALPQLALALGLGLLVGWPWIKGTKKTAQPATKEPGSSTNA